MVHHEDTGGAPAGPGGEVSAGQVATTVLHVGGLNWASEKAVVEGVLGREPGAGLRSRLWPPATKSIRCAPRPRRADLQPRPVRWRWSMAGTRRPLQRACR